MGADLAGAAGGGRRHGPGGGACCGVEPGSLRGFKDRATEAAIQFNEKFHDVPHPGRTRNKKGILAAFAAEHRHFLMAPDLSTVMSPGTRRRG